MTAFAIQPMAIVRDEATPKFRRLAGKIQGSGEQTRFLMRWGTRVRKTAMETAIGKGGRRFWREVARSINLVERSKEVTVEATHVAAAQKQFGGVIEAKGKAGGGAEALTIPITEEAEGQSAAKFVAAGLQLFAIKSDSGNAVLGYSREGEFVALFALVRRTKPQRPDPFFPEDGEIAEIGEEEAVLLVERA